MSQDFFLQVFAIWYNSSLPGLLIVPKTHCEFILENSQRFSQLKVHQWYSVVNGNNIQSEGVSYLFWTLLGISFHLRTDPVPKCKELTNWHRRKFTACNVLGTGGNLPLASLLPEANLHTAGVTTKNVNIGKRFDHRHRHGAGKFSSRVVTLGVHLN